MSNNTRKFFTQKNKSETAESKFEQNSIEIPFKEISIEELNLKNPSNTLVIIGNGFDLMHGVKSSYRDFQKSIGKNNQLRFYMETYLDTSDLWANLEDSLGKLNYSMFLDADVIDMWLDDFGAYDSDAQAADYFAAVETAIEPTFYIPGELKRRFRSWVKTLTVGNNNRPFNMLCGDYKVLSFNYTEFIETLYGARRENVCYIHGCRNGKRNGKPDELILGHKPGMEEEQLSKVNPKSIKYKNPHKRYIAESAMDTAFDEALWYENATTKDCDKIIREHQHFFDNLSDIEEIYIIGHSLSEVDYPYFREVCKQTNVAWYIGYHSLDDMKRLLIFARSMAIKDITVFKT